MCVQYDNDYKIRFIIFDGTIVPIWNFMVLLNYLDTLHKNEMSKTMCKNENNRGKIQIMADIVDLCKAGIRKTHIMYKGNLSYEQINRYLYELLEKELIIQNVDDGVLTYRATEKGRSFLQYYNLMLSILDENVISMQLPISKLA
jgi:predicted transcriptional regulator